MAIASTSVQLPEISETPHQPGPEHRLNIFGKCNLYSHVLVLYFDGTACMYKNSVTETMTTNCLRLHQK